MPNDDLSHDLEDLNLAATRVEKRLYRIRTDIAALVGSELRELLVELANVRDLTRAHHDRWAGVTFDDSPEQRTEWRPLCMRMMAVEEKLEAFARAVRDAGGQLPMPTPAPSSVAPKYVDDGLPVRQPESRL